MYSLYEMVIGLEIHVELKTNTKIFCSCKTSFGAEPNSECCPICMGLPGTMPSLNKKVVELAVKAGIATNSVITKISKQDRKNYFYPDLPKAYQISQFDLPLCKNGYVYIDNGKEEKKIGVTRIHIEEDAGKLIHDEEGNTFCDYNRCGIPLIEIVSEPDLRSAEEAVLYAKKIKSIMEYTDVSDCKMQEGSIRFDVNLSVRKKGEKKFGTRTEMKNINSFQYMYKAINYEFKRQVDEIEKGNKIYQETRRYDQKNDRTILMRKKENADDYRFFKEPDLTYIVLDDIYINNIKKEMPMLPDERKKMYIDKYHIKEQDAENIITIKADADYFEECLKYSKNPYNLSSLLVGEVFHKKDKDNEIKISAKDLSHISDLLSDNKINNSTAKKLINICWDENIDLIKFIEKNNMWQINDEKILEDIIVNVFNKNKEIIEEYKAGNEKVMKILFGKIMKETKCNGNPGIISRIITKIIK